MGRGGESALSAAEGGDGGGGEGSEEAWDRPAPPPTQMPTGLTPKNRPHKGRQVLSWPEWVRRPSPFPGAELPWT